MKYTFNVKNLECDACRLLINDILEDVNYINNSSISGDQLTVDVDKNIEKEKIKTEIDSLIKNQGYSLV